jgi:hypothetical protein
MVHHFKNQITPGLHSRLSIIETQLDVLSVRKIDPERIARRIAVHLSQIRLFELRHTPNVGQKIG